MSKRAFRVLTMLCLTIGLLLTLATAANAADLTPDYYISGSPGSYAVGGSEGGSGIGNYLTFVTALSGCSSDWGEKPGTPVIQLGSADTPLAVNRGDGKLVSATYTGAVNIEHASSTYGLWVGKDAPVELRDFTLTNSVVGIGGVYYAVFVETGGRLTIGSGTNISVQDGGVYDANPNALCNDGTVTINGDALLSIENKGRVITNCGTCTIGGNAEDHIDISASSSSGSILNFNSGILTIGTGTTVSSSAGLENYNIATISGGTLVSSKTTVKNDGRGTLYISGGTVRNTDTNGSSNALYNNSTAVVSGGVITSDSSCAILTMYRLTLEGDCQVSAPNGTAVGSNTNTKANSEIIIRENASITGKTTGVEASAASGSGGSGPSTLTITGGSISGNSCAVKTSANTEIFGGTLSASGPSITNSFALECSGGATVNISGGELFADSERYSAYGIYNKGATVNFSGGNVTATTTASTSDYAAYGIYNKENTSADISGGSITAKANVAVTNMKIYGLYNRNANANITGGTISSEGSGNTASAVFDEVSASPKGVFISGMPVLKSVSPHTVRLEKRTTDSGSLTYFGTSFNSNANAVVTIQGAQDEAAAAYVIDSSNFANAQACALPDAGYGSPRWTSDAERTNILSEASPASLSTLTASGGASVYLSVKRIYTVTVNQGSHGTAGADVSSATEGDMVTLTATPHYGCSFDGWTSASGVTFTDASDPNTTFTMPANAVTVTANWKANQYTVTFSPNGGSEVSPVTQDYNTKITSAPYTGKPGYTFTGWFADEGLNTAVGFPYTIAGSTTLYAKWTPNTYTLTFDSNGGSAETNITAKYGDSLTLPTPTRPNYAFSGWYESETDNNGSGAEFTAAAMPDLGGDGTTKTLYAKWTAKTEIGYAPAPQSYTYGTSGAAYTVSHLSLSGFTVEYDADSAWTATPPTDAGSYDVRISRAEDTTYASYASGTLSDHFVITNASQPVTSVTIGYAAETADTTALMEYSANGKDWTDCTENMAIASGWLGDDVHFRLKAKPNYDAGTTQTLSIPARPATPAATGTDETFFEQGNGSISGVSTAMEYKAGAGGTWQNIAGTELTGLTAGTYYIRVKATESSFKSLEQEITLQNGPKLTVTFGGQGGSTVAPAADLSYNASISAPSPAPTRTGHTFAGWYKEEACTNAWDFGTDKVTANITLYAKWDKEQYTLTFDSNGGSAETNITAKYGDSLTLPTPTRPNYAFSGWYESETDNNGSGAEFAATTMPDLGSSGTTKMLYAKWTAKREIGYAPAPQSYTYGTDGAAYTVSCSSLAGFTVEYYAGSAWTKTPPTGAGSYDVRITRAEDDTYASYASGTLDAHFVISPATLTVTIKPGLAITKVYDEGAAVDGVQSDWLLVNGLKNGETATAVGAWSYTNADAGTGKAVNITGISITYGTASSGNYTYTLAALSTTGEITNASQPVTSVTIDYAAETADTTALMEYSANGTDWTDCTASMAIASGWLGDDVYFRLKAKPNYDAGATQTLSIPARPATPAATGTDETFFEQGNGSISGVSTAMEYRAGAGGTWQNIAGTELTGLTAGTYYIRVKATESSFKSLEQEITLQNGPKLTVTFGGQGGSTVAPAADLSYNASISAPSPAPTRTGHTFAGWYKEEACTNAWDFGTDKVTANITLYAKWTRNPDDSEGTVARQPRTITVTETSSTLFSGSEGQISASANMDNAFANSVEVKVTDTQEDKAGFGFAAGDEVYPFDISLYIKGTDEKTEPAAGYSVTISLPVPASLMDVRELISVVHKSGSGAVTTLASRLEQRNGAWYLTFEATEFSPYALVVRSGGNYDESAGVPYSLDAKGSRVFIGFAANGRYIAPEGVSVYVTQNGKSFTDVSQHWAQSYIGFVTERELFLGTSGNAFSPDTGMTRAMFATVVGRLYERSYGEINPPITHAFTDCDYSSYYGKYVDWAAKNDIIGGYGNGGFGPDDSITREQMAAVLYRFADFLRVLPNDMDAALDYPDADSISSYAKNAALYCQTTGVIGGRTGGVFAPQETATRAEVATIIERFVESVVE